MKLDQRGKKRVIIVCSIIAALVLAAVYRYAADPARLIDLSLSNASLPQCDVGYPFDESVFPPEIPAPEFMWPDKKTNGYWAIGIYLRDERRPFYCTNIGRSPWRPTHELWDRIKKTGLGGPITFRIARVASLPFPHATRRGLTRIFLSPDSVGAPIFYREVNLPFAEAVKDPSKIRWRFGSIASPAGPPVVLENLPVCGNCHSFSNDGAMLGMDVDYANDKGSYAVAKVENEIVLDKNNIMTWMDFRRKDGRFTYGLLSRVSPTGRWVISTVKDRSVFVPKPDIAFSQLFFPVKGVLAVYTRASRSFAALPGADDPAFVQSNPAWSPDEKTVLFIRAKAYELKTRDNGALLSDEECGEFTKGGKPFKYDIYTVPFNDGKGGAARPFPGASNNGVSNFFPAFSPDGKFVVFCRAENYSLLQPDSRLYIVPASGGQARLMRCNRGRMNSWHSFSPNGRWLVFSSKEFSPYTQLFLAHVDANGCDAPPVLLEHFTGPNRAANIPEFVNTFSGKIRAISERFLDDFSFVRAAQEPLRLGDIPMAISRYKTALSINPNNAAAHFNLAYALEDQGDRIAAQEQYRLAIKADSTLAQAYNNLAILLSQEADGEAKRLYEKAISLQPGYADPHFNLGALLEQKKEYEDAATHFMAAIRLKSSWVQAFERLGDVRLKQRKMNLAQSAFMSALAFDSSYEKAKTGLAEIQKQKKQ